MMVRVQDVSSLGIVLKDRSKIILPTVSKKSVERGKQLARLVIQKLSDGSKMSGKLGLKGINSQEKVNFLIKTVVEVAQANSLEICYDSLGVAFYHCVHPEPGLSKVVGALAGLAGVNKETSHFITGKPAVKVNLFLIKQSLTKFILSHIHEPKLLSADDFEQKFGNTRRFFEKQGLLPAYESCSPRSLVGIAYPESLEFGVSFDPDIRPWRLLDVTTNTDELIAKAVAWILLN